VPYLAGMSTPYRLHYAPDNASLVARLALEEIGAPYETVLVDRSINAQKSPAYLALNPNGLIPVLETPQGPRFETGAILLWLADTHAMLAPAPNDPARGAFLKWLLFIANTLHADLRILFYPAKSTGPDATHQSALRDGIIPRLRKHLQHLDTQAGETPPWLSPDAPSALTLYLACLLRWMALYPAQSDRSWFALSDYPHLRRLLAALETRPSVQAACRAEGLDPAPFTSPTYTNPPEGSPT
jgi:glutathione S-transferase